MSGRSWTRKGKAGLYRISDRRYVAVRKITGSPCYMAEECYPCEDAPSGWYSSGRPEYIEAPSESEAALDFSKLCAAGKVALLELPEAVP